MTMTLVAETEIESPRRGSDPVLLNAPLLRGTPLGGALGAMLVLKVETLNPIRSFKGRGPRLRSPPSLPSDRCWRRDSSGRKRSARTTKE